MPYTVKHKSHNECLIEYVEDSGARKKHGLNLTMIVFGIIAVIFGIDIVVVFCLIVIMIFWKNLTRPPLRGFEIELNRPRNRITIKNTHQAQPKSTVYPLDNFQGFGLYETRSGKTSKPLSQLFLKFDEGVLDSPLAKKSGLIGKAKRTAEADGGFFWRVPIRDSRALTPNANAEKIMTATDEWLGRHAEDESWNRISEQDAQPEEPEILRDFRDME